MICPQCGGTLEIGGWPFCPDHAPGRSGAIADDIPGGITLENYGPNPVTFYSHSERRRYMREHGLEECVRHVPVPGTDKSPYTTSWASVDLDAAKALAERQAHTKAIVREAEPPAAVVAEVKRAIEEYRAR
jgi:hypothetical protein